MGRVSVAGTVEGGLCLGSEVASVDGGLPFGKKEAEEVWI